MTMSQKRIQVKDWICMALITLQVLRIASGYLAILQTQYVLFSPLIPADTIKQIAYDTMCFYLKPSLFTTVCLLGSLWLYFFNQKKLTIILSAVSLIGFEIWIRYFVI